MATASTTATRLEIDDVHFAYGKTPVLFGVSFSVAPGEILGLLGTNGAGKSTVLRVLAGLETPSSGRVVLDGEDVTREPAEDRLRRGVALVMGGRAVFADLTVRENLELGGFTLTAPVLDARMARELERFPALAARLGNLAGTLSGGEQQQLAVAKALLVDPRLLCIDELSLGLAPAVVADLLATVRQVNASGVTCVLVEQSLNLAAELCGRAVFLEKGEVRFEGDPRALLERGDLARAVFLGGDTPGGA
ncbi:MAG TPA: ABC transporter ATP-binding protein [Acidimicrobiales bacterium]|nr:ABC transporter ATP-binding protein [Acidimicrobiales bacterium]